MAAAATDKFQKVSIATVTTLDAPGYTIGNTSITVASTSTWPTDTGITFAMDEIDANGDRVAGSYNEYVGTVASGTSVTNVSHVNGTNQDYLAGTTTRVYIPVSEERENRLVDGILEEHAQDGTHTDVTADTIAVSGVSSLSDHIDVVDGKSIRDGNNNELITFSQTASAVNEVTIKNAATGNSPEIQATGGDTNIGLTFVPKGTGKPSGFANYKVGNIPTSVTNNSGNNAITGVGFTPKLVQFFYLGSDSTTGHFDGWGAMDASGGQFAHTSAGNTTNIVRYGSVTECMAMFTALSDNTPEFRAAFVSMDADGFTINVTANANVGGDGFGYIAFA